MGNPYHPSVSGQSTGGSHGSNITVTGNVFLGEDAVLDGVDVDGRIVIRGANATIRNVTVRGQVPWGPLQRLRRRLAVAFRSMRRRLWPAR